MSFFGVTQGPVSLIKSVQRGTMTIASLATTATAAISAVNTAKSELRFLGCFGTDTSGTPGNSVAHVVLTSGTVVTATRYNNTASIVTVSFEVTEFF